MVMFEQDRIYLEHFALVQRKYIVLGIIEIIYKERSNVVSANQLSCCEKRRCFIELLETKSYLCRKEIIILL